MPTSSAKPAKLRTYRDAGIAQVEKWEPEVTKLDTALTDLRTALSGLDLPEDCKVSVLFYETWFDTLTQNQRHLDEWVGDVADGFIEAGGGDPNGEIDPNWSVTVPDSSIVVGYADRAESERQAREDAAALAEILGDTGMVHPYEIMNDPEKLEELTAQYPELRDILARSQRFVNDESYAVELVNTLGPQNVRTMVDLVNTFGIAADRGDEPGYDAWDGYVVPLATILGNADRSGRMDDSVRDAIFDMDATDEPPMAGTNSDFIQEGTAEDMRYRSLALILNAGDFSPQTTAEMANTLMDTPHPQFYDHSGFTSPVFLQDHRELASNQWAAMDALAHDDHAANIFYRMDSDGNGELENLYLMNGVPGTDVAAQRLGLSPGDVRAETDVLLADSLRGGILEYPLATGTTYSPETTDLVARAIEAAGWEHTDAPGPVRTALAQISTPYTLDIAVIAAGGGPDLPDSRLPGIDGDEISAFLQEVSESEDGRVALSQNAAALVREQIDADVPDIVNGDPYAVGTGEVLSAAYYTELGEAWDAVQVGWVEQREALVAGWRSVTDPVVDLVSGKIVEKIPGVNVAADMPIVSTVVDGITDGIKDSINSAIYDNAIPEPELEDMRTWRDAIGEDVNTAVATSLYENEESRRHFLDMAREQDPETWERINADGEVTLDEFRSIPDVQDAVNTHAGDIVSRFQAEMAFDKAYGDG